MAVAQGPGMAKRLSTAAQAFFAAGAFATVASGCADAPAFELSGDGPADGRGDSAVRSVRVVAAIEEWNAGISAEDREAKYCKMADSAFGFFRGTSHLFWEDLAYHPRIADFGNRNTITWITGDQHIENFGVFDDSRGEVVFSLNDFDDAVIADYQYDVWRTAISIVLAAEQFGVLTDDEQAEVIEGFAEAYLDAIARFSDTDDALDAIFSADNTRGVLRDFIEHVEETRGRDRKLRRWTELEDGERVFDVSRDNLTEVTEEEEAAIRAAMAGYLDSLAGEGADLDEDYFEIKSIARRLGAGTGSLGADRYYLLIEGATDSLDDDRILDVKEQFAPAPYRYFSAEHRELYDRTFTSHAQRHAHAYRALERHVDPHLGWMELDGISFSVRERTAYRRTLDTESLRDVDEYLEMAAYWGEILAAGHARGGRDFDEPLLPFSVAEHIDAAAGGARGNFSALVGEVAFVYADRVEQDWRSFLTALAPAECE